MSDPSPQQRADYIVRKLEHFIREGKGERGMSFKTWQALARAELYEAFVDVERRQTRRKGDVTIKRLLACAAAALVTIGFWGGVVSHDKSYGTVAAVACLAAGLVLFTVATEAGLRGILFALKDRRRRRSFTRIEDFDVQLKRLEAIVWRKLRETEKRAEQE